MYRVPLGLRHEPRGKLSDGGSCVPLGTGYPSYAHRTGTVASAPRATTRDDGPLQALAVDDEVDPLSGS